MGMRCISNQRLRPDARIQASDGNIVNAYGPSYTWQFVFGYLIIAAIFVSLWRLQKNREKLP